MKRIKIGLPLFLILIFSCCSSQKSEWQGTVEILNGITIVKNPKKPIYELDAFDLEEEITIGEKAGREEYLFSNIHGAVDDDENIYVNDYKEVEIRIFDKNGNYIKSFGKEGQGPGEIQRPFISNFQITPQNEILVHDFPTRRILFFNLNGDYLREISLVSLGPVAIDPLIIDYNGNILACLLYPPVKESLSEVKLFDPNLSLVATLKTLRGPFQMGVAYPFRPSPCIAVTPENNIVLGITNMGYRLSIYDTEGVVKKRIEKDFNPVDITNEDKTKLEARYSRGSRKMEVQFPNHFPAFRDIYTDDDGRIFARTYEKVKDRKDYFYFDVFDSYGKFMARAPLKADGVHQYLWKKGKLYTIEEDDEGYQCVKRYNVTWNY